MLPFSVSLLLLLVFHAGHAIAGRRHVIIIPTPGLAPAGLAWDRAAQHFLVGSRHPPAIVSSVSDAGVVETLLVSDTLLPSSSSVVALAVDEYRRRLLLALSRPPALAAYDLRSPRPHRRIFLTSLPDPSAAPGGVAVDPATGTAFVTAGRQILKVDLEGEASVFSMSEIYSGELGGVAHVSRGFLLVVEPGTGRLFKVDNEDGAAKAVLMGKRGLQRAAEGVAVKSDGGALVVGGGSARWLKSGDGWSEAAVYDETAMEEGWKAAAVAVRSGRRAYVLVTAAAAEEEEDVKMWKKSRIEEVEWETESGEGEMVWGMVLLGLGLACFLYWRFQMGQLISSMNKKRA